MLAKNNIGNYTMIIDFLIAICTGGCGVNKECTAPQSCTCVPGWTGQDCLTGTGMLKFVIDWSKTD